MEHVDDSGGDVATHFREREQAYLQLMERYIERPGILRDLLELAAWEGYGLFHHIEPFLAKLPERAADLALRVLALIISELRDAELECQCGEARRLRRAALRAADALDAAEGDAEAVCALPVDRTP